MLIYANQETSSQKYFALKMYTFSQSPNPLFRPFDSVSKLKKRKRKANSGKEEKSSKERKGQRGAKRKIESSSDEAEQK